MTSPNLEIHVERWARRPPATTSRSSCAIKRSARDGYVSQAECRYHRADDPGRLVLRGRVSPSPGGAFWFSAALGARSRRAAATPVRPTRTRRARSASRGRCTRYARGGARRGQRVAGERHAQRRPVPADAALLVRAGLGTSGRFVGTYTVTVEPRAVCAARAGADVRAGRREVGHGHRARQRRLRGRRDRRLMFTIAAAGVTDTAPRRGRRHRRHDAQGDLGHRTRASRRCSTSPRRATAPASDYTSDCTTLPLVRGSRRTRWSASPGWSARRSCCSPATSADGPAEGHDHALVPSMSMSYVGAYLVVHDDVACR